MKSTEVYRALRETLDSYCKAEGFKRTRGGMLGWSRPLADRFVTFWCQCSRDGWDSCAGSKFTVELQDGDAPLPGFGQRNQRIGRLLSAADREVARDLQNQVIAGLPRPPADHPLLQGSLADYYRQNFEPVHRVDDDLWFRYYSVADVIRWGEFLRAQLPDALRKFGGAAPP
jgi:hypothetical protein